MTSPALASLPFAANISFIVASSVISRPLSVHVELTFPRMMDQEGAMRLLRWWGDIQTFLTTTIAGLIGVMIDSRLQVPASLLLVWAFARLIHAWRIGPSAYDKGSWPLFFALLSLVHPRHDPDHSPQTLTLTTKPAGMRKVSGATRFALASNLLVAAVALV